VDHQVAGAAVNETQESPTIQVIVDERIDYDLSAFLKPSDPARADFGQNFYWCLPMLAANTLGWTLYNPVEFSVMWRGGGDRSAVMVECDDPEWVKSWFGYGTFTLFPPFFVRTSPDIDVWVRPVANYARPGVLTMEGVVETDWLQAGFTLNFMLLLPLSKLVFKVGDPLVQFVPYPRGFIERFTASIVPASQADPQMVTDYNTWVQRRTAQLRDQGGEPSLDYMRGVKLDGEKAEGHQKRFRPPSFLTPPSPIEQDNSDREA
jgi:hypothetical protein